MNLMPNDWKHLLKTGSFQKSLLKAFYYNIKGTRKVFKNISNKEIYFILQSNCTKHNNLSGSGVKLLLIGLRNTLMDKYFLTPQ